MNARWLVVNYESFSALFPICGYAGHNPGAHLASSKKSLSFLSSASPVRGTCCKHKGAIFLFLRAGGPTQPSHCSLCSYEALGNVQHVRQKNKTQILAKIMYSLPKEIENFNLLSFFFNIFYPLLLQSLSLCSIGRLIYTFPRNQTLASYI